MKRMFLCLLLCLTFLFYPCAQAAANDVSNLSTDETGISALEFIQEKTNKLDYPFSNLVIRETDGKEYSLSDDKSELKVLFVGRVTCDLTLGHLDKFLSTLKELQIKDCSVYLLDIDSDKEAVAAYAHENPNIHAAYSTDYTYDILLHKVNSLFFDNISYTMLPSIYVLNNECNPIYAANFFAYINFPTVTMDDGFALLLQPYSDISIAKPKPEPEPPSSDEPADDPQFGNQPSTPDEPADSSPTVNRPSTPDEPTNKPQPGNQPSASDEPAVKPQPENQPSSSNEPVFDGEVLSAIQSTIKDIQSGKPMPEWVPSYSDISQSSNCASAVNALSALGIISGYPDGTFNPDGNITRAEMAKMLIVTITGRSDGSENPGNFFPDVAAGKHWAAKYVASAYERGFIKGFEDGTFRPDENITYEQAITMIVRMLKGEKLAVERGGYPDGYFSVGADWHMFNGLLFFPKDNAKRYAVSMLLFNALKDQSMGNQTNLS